MDATSPGDRSKAPGRFIALEGPDGAGKSLQAARLADSLRSSGTTVTLTREPGGTPLGEAIRRLLLETGEVDRGALADAFLFSAARAQSVREVIRPALERGDVVVCDRFADSTLAYQGHGAGVPLDVLRELQRFATDGLRPDLVVLLDLPVAEGLARRRRGSAEELTRFERSAAHDVPFHERVRRGYLESAAADPERWRIVDAAQEVDAVAAAIADVVRDALGSAGSPGPGEPRGELLRIDR